MPDEKDKLDEKVNQTVPFSRHTQKRYPEAEPILDSTCSFEEMDRGEGMAVDDEKTYHHTEK